MVRKYDPSDTRDAREVQARSWLATYPSADHGITREWVEDLTSSWLTPDALAEWRAIIEQTAADPTYLFRVAESDGRIVGLLHAALTSDGRAELRAIYVDPPLIGRGVGAALVAEFDAWASGKPAILDVAGYNVRAIEFYQRHGFEEVPGLERLVDLWSVARGSLRCFSQAVPRSEDPAESQIPLIDMTRPEGKK
jgi:GNAT superfamily N-acetyltransferase